MNRRGVLAGMTAVGLTTGHTFARARPQSPVAMTAHGPVRGFLDRGIRAFKGIRYGRDTGPMRFQAPASPVPWKHVVEAFEFGPSAPQRDRSVGGTSEDCLFLNVWTPALRDGGNRPVMVYIHGGAYSNGSGSSPLYDGVRLCLRGDVVVVTVNHRLNAFGYAYLSRLSPGFENSGNAGQLDLVLALRWVEANIAEFGGDPRKVMVFGQSGGGAKIATLMAMPRAEGLFHRAATMSGQQVTASGPGNATRRTLAWMDALKLKSDNLAALTRLPSDLLVEAMGIEDPVLEFGGLYFGPVLDEVNLRRHPFYPDAPPQSAGIPMMIGNTHDETRAFMGGDPTNFTVDWSGLPGKLTQAAMRVDIDPATVIAEYRRLHPDYSPSDVLFAATTASRSWRAAVIEAEARAAAGAPAYVYQLDWISPIEGGRLGAPHMADIPLVFDNIAAEGSRATGPDAQGMANQMSQAFLAFARNGDPNCPSLPLWEPYALPRRQTMVFNAKSRLVDDPRGGERALFAKVPFIQAGS